MKVAEIRNLSDQDLDKQLYDLQSELFNLRFRLATGQLENPSAIGSVKRDIARVKTIQTERKLNLNREA
ncbi:50S ribosomal protein L29 [Anaerococcus prevotii]|uniref:Large ribosomal subunit protein uL29 n=1 Tax=Anaerococcus prevotii (strain ATCC 9321 / DSM 20548 / JCM 6508 / NCTC 11806 / PC1) TaxID=525919 RepID=C7REH4_ANAPD|nr:MULTISPECIES: 50S ribosomal protein L29 [Anaerococcus]MDD6919534.1 50S ribosomal protein L29 [Peptoniphilaceae bacterium]ACV29587.1 ribosomal protein L29 [Anaerococcus prevotii DSM 20548]MCI5972391.1 50S ribosomal protein L29 [Anaerococcus sp.]MDU2558612.1 50S ribosomal protein L29 [Anaerococcus prevotii]MDU2584044.1 50S ribosomal protein L29 [Anaerococcus prevotii]